MISWDSLFLDSDLHPIKVNDIMINHNRSITIHDNVWIGCRRCILKGMTIPQGSIIASNSVIYSSPIEENTIISSNRIIKTNIKWERTLLK